MDQKRQVSITVTLTGNPQAIGAAVARLLAALPAAEQLSALQQIQKAQTQPKKTGK